MHIPKAARLTLKHLFKFDDAFFDALDRIDIDRVQSGIMDIVQTAQDQFPDALKRIEAMETGVRVISAQQRAIIQMLEEVLERMNEKEGGIPVELPGAQSGLSDHDNLAIEAAFAVQNGE
jgi:hypothetical protein